MERQRLSENMLTFVPFMFKRIMKHFNVAGISKQQLGLLFHICSDNGKPMSYYSEKMNIPKSNLTVISDKLIKDGYIDREFDAADRRIIILRITEKGMEFLNEQKELIKGQMLKKLEVLEDTDVKRLNELIDEMKAIFRKMDQ